MTIALEFAEQYMLGVVNRPRSEIENLILGIYEMTDITNVVVSMYWEISNKYDYLNHRPIPSREYMTMAMDYNLDKLYRYILEHHDLYGQFNLYDSIKLTLDNNIMDVRICPDDHFGCNCDSHWV